MVRQACLPLLSFALLATGMYAREMLKRVAEILFIPLEIGLVAWITVRTARSLRSTRGTEDMMERLREVAREILPMPRVAEVIAFEMSVLYYSFFAWHRYPRYPQSPSGTQAFTYHRTSGYGAILFALLIATLAEAIPVHILVARWSPDVAWILTNLAAYGLFWFVADYRATRLRPIVLDEENLCIRTGVRWTIRIPRAHIVAIHKNAPKSEPFLQATLPRVKPLWIELAEPVTARGPYGIKKQARWISVAVDDAKAFQEAIPGSAGIPAGPI